MCGTWYQTCSRVICVLNIKCAVCILVVRRGVDSTLAHCVHVEYATKCAMCILAVPCSANSAVCDQGRPKKVAIAHRQNRVIYPHQPQPPSPLTAPLSLARVQTRHKLGPQQKQNTNTETHTNYQIENTMRLQGRTKNNL